MTDDEIPTEYSIPDWLGWKPGATYVPFVEATESDE